MGQSLSKLYVHLIFSTKNRHPFITSLYEDSLYKNISGIFKNLNSPVLAINSMPDHLHVLFILSKNSSLAGTVEEVKKSSSKWMKSQGCESFSWQIGYGAFSISQSNVEMVTKYIVNQKDHHKKFSFEEEVKDFMKKYEMGDFHEDYFWR
ncbi:IS200/IS605 family transposase [Salinimicrobium xinjiangense]|uniref:IS200/IS605 family transposase n=1 Tax=Salinimicrobium xinjiangense TaxID=438596 RepID=UPI00048F08B8|nr:IS200/IS605 family transposase [Salinimicrobium xinjiangense]